MRRGENNGNKNNSSCESCPEKLLQRWSLNQIKHKNLMTKDLHEIKEKKYDLLCIYETKRHYFMIIPFLHGIEEILEKMRYAKLEFDANFFSVVVLNAKHNLNLLIANWNKFIGFPELNLFFVNPFSKLEKKWIINPHFHHRISDKASLETGLKSIFSSVEKIDKKMVKEIFG